MSINVNSCDLLFFFFNDTATTEIYTLSLHDALPILQVLPAAQPGPSHATTVEDQREAPLDDLGAQLERHPGDAGQQTGDRKSTRLNSSHANISYAVFCLKKKTKNIIICSLESISPKY